MQLSKMYKRLFKNWQIQGAKQIWSLINSTTFPIQASIYLEYIALKYAFVLDTPDNF